VFHLFCLRDIGLYRLIMHICLYLPPHDVLPVPWQQSYHHGSVLGKHILGTNGHVPPMDHHQLPNFSIHHRRKSILYNPRNLNDYFCCTVLAINKNWWRRKAQGPCWRAIREKKSPYGCSLRFVLVPKEKWKSPRNFTKSLC
jgi:hypothetical protein